MAIRPTFAGRTLSGIEAFDLVGGYTVLFAVDMPSGLESPRLVEVGFTGDVGFLSRSADTHFFADVRAERAASILSPRLRVELVFASGFDSRLNRMGE